MPESTSGAYTSNGSELLADVLAKLLKAGFAQRSVPVEGVITMQRAWQGADEDAVIVDVVTMHSPDQALATREGVDRVPLWGPTRGAWLDVVAALLGQPPPRGFVAVPASGTPQSTVALLGVCPFD
jgi:hypothetical protein